MYVQVGCKRAACSSENLYTRLFHVNHFLLKVTSHAVATFNVRLVFGPYVLIRYPINTKPQHRPLVGRTFHYDPLSTLHSNNKKEQKKRDKGANSIEPLNPSYTCSPRYPGTSIGRTGYAIQKYSNIAAKYSRLHLYRAEREEEPFFRYHLQQHAQTQYCHPFAACLLTLLLPLNRFSSSSHRITRIPSA